GTNRRVAAVGLGLLDLFSAFSVQAPGEAIDADFCRQTLLLFFLMLLFATDTQRVFFLVFFGARVLVDHSSLGIEDFKRDRFLGRVLRLLLEVVVDERPARRVVAG